MLAIKYFGYNNWNNRAKNIMKTRLDKKSLHKENEQTKHTISNSSNSSTNFVTTNLRIFDTKMNVTTYLH